MKIDERIEEMQSKLIRILTETNLDDKEEGIKLLERFGLDIEHATKLLDAFRNAESARNTAKMVWDTTLNTRSGDDISTDIEKSQQQELDTRQLLDSVNAECALLIVARRLDPNKIDDEILGKLYEQGIQEEQINNPALKMTYHYYCETKERENDKSADSEKFRAFVSKVKAKLEHLEKRIKELENQNEMLSKENINLRYKFSARIVEDERHYQEALSQNRELKRMLNQLQSRGIFQVIGDKILGRNKIRRLPGATSELPETLHKNKAEKVVLEVDEDTLNKTSAYTQTAFDNRTDDELQQ